MPHQYGRTSTSPGPGPVGDDTSSTPWRRVRVRIASVLDVRDVVDPAGVSARNLEPVVDDPRAPPRARAPAQARAGRGPVARQARPWADPRGAGGGRESSRHSMSTRRSMRPKRRCRSTSSSASRRRANSAISSAIRSRHRPGGPGRRLAAATGSSAGAEPAARASNVRCSNCAFRLERRSTAAGDDRQGARHLPRARPTGRGRGDGATGRAARRHAG